MNNLKNNILNRIEKLLPNMEREDSLKELELLVHLLDKLEETPNRDIQYPGNPIPIPLPYDFPTINDWKVYCNSTLDHE